MSIEDPPETGTSEGTHAAGKIPGAAQGDQIAPDPERAAKIGATRATVEAAMGDLVAGIEKPGEPEQATMMLDEMDEQFALFAGPVKHVADTIERARGRGRPKGSTNKNAFRDQLLRMGFRHPGINLAAMANADPHELAKELGGYTIDKEGRVILLECSPLDAMNMIIKANAELLPYFEGKAAQTLDVNVKALGVMVIGDMKTDRGADESVIDLTSVPAPE